MNGRTTLYCVENCEYDYGYEYDHGSVRYVKSINQVVAYMAGSLNDLMSSEHTTTFFTRTMFMDFRLYD